MGTNPDFSDLFSIFNDEAVEYLVAGAHAVMFHTVPRYTKDLDVWVNPTPENAERVYRALKRFGAPLEDVSVEDLQQPDLMYQIGVAPNRIDVMMGIAGVTFEEAWPDRVQSTYGGIAIQVLGRKTLVKAKRASGRPQDLLDADNLENAD